MSRRLLTPAICLALGACAAPGAAKLAVCDGQHRRPANPHGSVLVSAAPAATPSAAAMSPGPTSEAALAASYRACGGRP